MNVADGRDVLRKVRLTTKVNGQNLDQQSFEKTNGKLVLKNRRRVQHLNQLPWAVHQLQPLGIVESHRLSAGKKALVALSNLFILNRRHRHKVGVLPEGEITRKGQSGQLCLVQQLFNAVHRAELALDNLGDHVIAEDLHQRQAAKGPEEEKAPVESAAGRFLCQEHLEVVDGGAPEAVTKAQLLVPILVKVITTTTFITSQQKHIKADHQQVEDEDGEPDGQREGAEDVLDGGRFDGERRENLQLINQIEGRGATNAVPARFVLVEEGHSVDGGGQIALDGRQLLHIGGHVAADEEVQGKVGHAVLRQRLEDGHNQRGVVAGGGGTLRQAGLSDGHVLGVADIAEEANLIVRFRWETADGGHPSLAVEVGQVDARCPLLKVDQRTGGDQRGSVHHGVQVLIRHGHFYACFWLIR